MAKREFIESIIVRCAPLQGAKPYYLVRYALECWEALEMYGNGTSAGMPIEVVGAVTGPRNPGFS